VRYIIPDDVLPALLDRLSSEAYPVAVSEVQSSVRELKRRAKVFWVSNHPVVLIDF